MYLLGLKVMRKTYLIIPIVMVIVALMLFELHSFKKIYWVTFADDEIIASDGAGPYPVPDAIQVTFSSMDYLLSTTDRLIVDMRYSARYIKCNFHNSQWKDESMINTVPRLFTDDYHIQFAFSYMGKYDELRVGDRLRIVITEIYLIDKDDVNKYVLSITRCQNASLTDYYVPHELYDEGDIELIRESEDVWVIDADGWFRAVLGVNTQMTYFIKLSFKMSIEYGSII